MKKDYLKESGVGGGATGNGRAGTMKTYNTRKSTPIATRQGTPRATRKATPISRKRGNGGR